MKSVTNLLRSLPCMEIRSSTPAGVTVIAIVLFLFAAYLGVIGAIMLASPGKVSMALGAPLLGGLELDGPYMFLLAGSVGALIGWGLFRLNNWARRAAMLLASIGVAMLIPSVSANAISLQFGNLAWGGLGIIARVMILWYLHQEPTRDAFVKD